MSNTNLSLNERILIEQYSKLKISISEIGRTLGRHKSTISRELRRNSWHQTHYYSWFAELKYLERKKDSRTAYKSSYKDLIANISKYLKLGYNPDVIVNRLKVLKTPIGVCTETIYQIVYRNFRQGGDLFKYLPLERKRRKKRLYKRDKRGVIGDFRSIHSRSESVDKLNSFNHWEMDTIIGSHHKGNLLSLIERKSKYLNVRKLKSKHSSIVKKELKALSSKYKMLTTTTDQGREFSKFKEIEKECGMKIYFCDKGSPWQKGMIENANRIIRRHLPKSLRISQLDQNILNKVVKKINNIPRKMLNYKTPFEVYYRLALQS